MIINKKTVILLVTGIVCYFFGFTFGIGNQTQKFGETGFPKNCRALIATNINGYSEGRYTAQEALDSIDRNCGAFGLIWNER